MLIVSLFRPKVAVHTANLIGSWRVFLINRNGAMSGNEAMKSIIRHGPRIKSQRKNRPEESQDVRV
jgi:hypothetical protein